MDVRVLRYFLTVAREESFSRAADALFLSQPTLSRQIKEMEDELGVQLLRRTNRNVQLTPEGQRLRNRAQEIVDLMDKTQEEFQHLETEIAGTIYIGCGETQIMREIAKIAIPLQQEHPGIRFHLYSAIGDDVMEKLDRGLLDFGLVFQPFDLHKYESLQLPFSDTFGFLMRKDHPLASLPSLGIEDLRKEPLIMPAQGSSLASVTPPPTLGIDLSELNIVCQYNLLFNAAVMVEQGMGVAFCLDHLVDTGEHSDLTFRPMIPSLSISLFLIWKRYQILSPAAGQFMQRMQTAFSK